MPSDRRGHRSQPIALRHVVVRSAGRAAVWRRGGDDRAAGTAVANRAGRSLRSRRPAGRAQLRRAVARSARLATGRAAACRVEVAQLRPSTWAWAPARNWLLSVVAGLNAFHRRASRSNAGGAGRLAGRAVRSAIGTYGFAGRTDRRAPASCRRTRSRRLKRASSCPTRGGSCSFARATSAGFRARTSSVAFASLPPVPRDDDRAAMRRRSRANCCRRPSAATSNGSAKACIAMATRPACVLPPGRRGVCQPARRRVGRRDSPAGRARRGPKLLGTDRVRPVEIGTAAGRFRQRLRRALDSQDSIVVAEPNNTGAESRGIAVMKQSAGTLLYRRQARAA